MPFKEKSSLGHLGGMGEKMIPIPAPKCIPKKAWENYNSALEAA